VTVSLDEARFVARGAVFKGGNEAGRLERTSDGVEFAYLQEYLAGGGPQIATTLPLNEEPVRTAAGALPPFFSGLLPEGRRLTALRQAVKTSADDELSLLLAVGSDVIGDVQIVPAGRTPETTQPAVTVESWDRVRFVDLFARSSGSPAGIDRVGLPGVQDKVSAQRMAIPVARQGERYILKLNPPEFPHVVENEAFFLEAARRSGVTAARAEVVRDMTGDAGLLVTRFDRVPQRVGEPRMLAQEDGCQALGRYPADKYNMTSEEVVRALAGATGAPLVSARELLRQLAFAYLSCNGDAHAKNLSILANPGSEWRVAPAYDVPCTHLYDDYTMALSVGGLRAEDITRKTFIEFGESVGVRPAATEGVLDGLCERSELWVARVAELPFDERRLIKLKRAIEYRRDRLSGR
jgi:serine/threonine-protein kinase HipA